jgi:hypothetical protein
VSDHGHVLSLADEVVDAVEDASASGGSSTVDAALVDWLAGDASGSIHVLIKIKQMYIFTRQMAIGAVTTTLIISS